MKMVANYNNGCLVKFFLTNLSLFWYKKDDWVVKPSNSDICYLVGRNRSFFVVTDKIFLNKLLLNIE